MSAQVVVLCPRGILNSLCALCGWKGAPGLIPQELAAAYRLGGFVTVYALVNQYPDLVDHMPPLRHKAATWQAKRDWAG